MGRKKKTATTESLTEVVQNKLNDMQMEVIRNCSDINQVKFVIEVFEEMNKVAEKLRDNEPF